MNCWAVFGDASGLDKLGNLLVSEGQKILDGDVFVLLVLGCLLQGLLKLGIDLLLRFKAALKRGELRDHILEGGLHLRHQAVLRGGSEEGGVKKKAGA